MMIALDSGSRRALATAALLSFAAGFVSMPTAARSDAARLNGQRSPAAESGPSHGPITVLPQRDPFADPASDGAETRSDALPQRRAALSAAPGLGALPVLPPNAGAMPPNMGALRKPVPAIRVTATVTGSRPYALVEEAGVTRVVTRGDIVGGEAIGAIDAAGLHFLRRGALTVPAPDAAAAP